MKKLLLILALLSNVIGCRSASEDTPRLSEKEAELFESILRERYENYSPPDEKVYYLTCTPESDWPSGRVEDFPDSFYRRVSDLPVHFRKATEATHLGGVFFKDPKTDKSAYMVGITINRWISKTEVEVQMIEWYEPLWGSGNTFIYLKRDGQWQQKETLDAWIS